MPRPRNVYQKGTNMFLMCRVCLTQSANMMFDLTDDLELDGYTDNKLSTVEALQRVTSSKIVLNGQFPHYICPICMSILKMSLKFIMQYKDSQEKLNTMYGLQDVDDCDDHDILNYLKLDTENTEKENHAPVEVIYNKCKFDLNDIIVVEKAEQKKNEFKGFLENLGKEISATFAEKSSKNKVDTDGEGSTVSISVRDNDRVFPIRELQLDEDANLINYIVDDPISIQIIDEETLENKSEPLDNIEYIQMESLDQDVINSFIIEEEQSNSTTEENCNADQPRPKRTIKVGKRRRKIKSKLKAPNNDDIFEREVRFPCEICRRIFPSNRLLKAHVKRIHFPKSQTFTCEVCGYNNNSRSAYVNHKLKHVGKQFKCEICDKPYYTKAVLKVHLETHINKRQHLCNVCGKGFNYANALVYHMRLHTGEKNYKCEYCEKSFRMPNSLQRHIRVHTGERPYKCKFCQRAFSSKGEVSCHENIHTGFRPYHCKYCKKGFSKTHNLKLHLLSHDGPHKCKICLKSFIEEAILSMHYKITHRYTLPKSEDEDGCKENSDIV